ncbi:hypothetical protein ACOMCU_00625 [Lysinibacillus sp. UGB7]|uniref:hypothetical protein n=1 Tax=Lysinibacillus sp. UGB7 TaxID=3411039 RepID=UPI003B803FF4
MSIVKHIESMNCQEQQSLREELILLMNEDATLLKDNPTKRFIVPVNAVIADRVDVVEDLMDVIERVDSGTDFFVSALLILVKIFTSEQLIGISHLEQASFYEQFKAAGYLDEISTNI